MTVLLSTHDIQVVDTFAFHKKVARLCDATEHSVRCRWPTSFETSEPTVTNQLVDRFYGKLPEVSLASVDPEFLLDNKRIEKCLCARLAVDSYHLYVRRVLSSQNILSLKSTAPMYLLYSFTVGVHGTSRYLLWL